MYPWYMHSDRKKSEKNTPPPKPPSWVTVHGRHMLTRAISPAPAARTVSTKNLSIIDTIPVYADGQEATEAKIVQLQF